MYSYEEIKLPCEPTHWRVRDAHDNRVATCYDEENARLVVLLMNNALTTPNLFADVGEFHAKFGLPIAGDRPADFLRGHEELFRRKFLQEELDEFGAACNAGDLPKAADALADLVYVALGTAHFMGVPFNEVWREVQRANMAKERATSRDDERSARKHKLDVVKPAEWTPPDHTVALATVGWSGE